MDPKLEHIAAELKRAREAHNISQRELSARVALPQAHISKIESGSVNLKLASLVEMARALDLEVMLVPRKLVPAVQAITRSADADAPSGEAARAGGALRKLDDQLHRLAPNHEVAKSWAAHSKSDAWALLARAIQELKYFRLSAEHIAMIKRAVDTLKRQKPGQSDEALVRKIADELRQLRNALAHGVATPVPGPRPAYSLADGDEDA